VREYDVIVVGGGINGCGIAQAVAAAGHSVLLLEKTAVGAGTSSKSSKLIHGGLRYLESFEFGLVRESLRERALLLRLAPELVHLQQFRVPLYDHTRRGPLTLRAGLSLYYLLSGGRPEARFRSLPRARWAADGLRTDGLRAVFCYSDARTDDRALTRAVLRSAVALGAESACPAELISAELSATGAEVVYCEGDAEVTCRARVLVNAAGPWVNEVSARVRPSLQAPEVELVQGAHIELPGDWGGDFYYVESPSDGRAVFVMPREGRLLVGTTETPHIGDPSTARALPEEVSYLLRVVGHYFPALRELGPADVLDSWAGLRVLPGGAGAAFSRSREALFHADRHGTPRMLSLYGGKLTTYRATAEQMLERLQPALPVRSPVADTRELNLTPE